MTVDTAPARRGLLKGVMAKVMLVGVVGLLGAIIAQINDTQATIASAVEEQTATTNEMGRNVSDAAGGAGRIASSVQRSAVDADTSVQTSAELVADTDRLASSAGDLRSLVAHFRV